MGAAAARLAHLTRRLHSERALALVLPQLLLLPCRATDIWPCHLAVPPKFGRATICATELRLPATCAVGHAMPLPRTLPPLPPTLVLVQPAGDRAWDTVLGAYAPVMRGEAVTDAAVYSVVLQIPLEGEHILM